MSQAPVKILDWGRIYQDTLTAEILRNELRRVTILAGLFAFAACVYSFFSFAPGPLDDECCFRLQAQWPWIVSLHAAVAFHEWGLRAGIDRLIERQHEPHAVLRFLNEFFEMSIPG